MNEHMNHTGDDRWNSDNRLIRQQTKRLVLTIVSLGGSIGLYYLGFFGTVEGPLNPEKISAAVAGSDISPGHLLAGLFLTFMVSISWNWVYNLINRTKKHSTAEKGHETDVKRKITSKDFQPVRKGPWSHSIWVGSLIGLIGLCVHLI